MSEIPIELIVAAFDDEDSAEEAMKELKAAKKEHLIGIQAAVAMRKDEKGKIHFKDVGMTPGKGAAGGAVLGAVVGVLTGGVGLVLGAIGGVIGGLIGKARRDSRLDVGRVNQIADALKPGSSAIIAVIEHKWVAALQQELEEMGADLMTAAISQDIADQLAEHRDVAYSALVGELGVTMGRVAVGDDEVQVSQTSLSDAGIVHEEALVTEAGAAYSASMITDEGEVSVAAIAAAEDADDEEDAAEEEES